MSWQLFPSGLRRRSSSDSSLPTAEMSAQRASGGVNRRAFLGGTAAIAAGTRASRAAAQSPKPERAKVLVLSGGITYGSYEAGVLSGLAKAKGGSLSYNFICGTSIGALNGAVFSAGSTDKLNALWHSIGKRVVLKPKSEYAKIPVQSHGVGDRLYQLGRLVYDMTKGEGQGVSDSEPIKSILREFLVREGEVRPFRVPLFWTATDVTTGNATYFKWPPTAAASEIAYALRAVFESPNIVYETPQGADEFVEALRSSSAIPVVFDPAKRGSAPAARILVDGGVLNNTPFSLVRMAIAQGPVDVDVVMLGPDFTRLGSDKSRNAVGLLGGLLDIVRQQQISDGLRSLKYEVAAANARGRSSADDVRIRVIRPSVKLTGDSLDFTDQTNISANLRLGEQDIQNYGFVPYDIPPNPFDPATL